MGGVRVLDRAAILAAKAKSRKRERVWVEAWGGAVWVHELSGTERDAYEDSIRIQEDGTRNMANIRARLCVLALRDEHGARLFTDADVAELGEHGSSILDHLFTVAQRLNALSDADITALAKNSEPGLIGASSSA